MPISESLSAIKYNIEESLLIVSNSLYVQELWLLSLE